MVMYLDVIGLSMGRGICLRICMNVDLHALAIFHGMVWGEVELEME